MMSAICEARDPESCPMKTTINSCIMDNSCNWEFKNENLTYIEEIPNNKIYNKTSLIQVINSNIFIYKMNISDN